MNSPFDATKFIAKLEGFGASLTAVRLQDGSVTAKATAKVVKEHNARTQAEADRQRTAHLFENVIPQDKALTAPLFD